MSNSLWLQACQVQGSGLAVRASADAALAGVALGVSLAGCLQQAQKALGPLLLSQAAAATAQVAQEAAQQTSSLPAASAAASAAAQAADEQSQAQAASSSVQAGTGSTVDKAGSSISGSRQGKLQAMAAQLSTTLHLEAVSLVFQLAQDVTWGVQLGVLAGSMQPGQVGSLLLLDETAASFFLLLIAADAAWPLSGRRSSSSRDSWLQRALCCAPQA